MTQVEQQRTRRVLTSLLNHFATRSAEREAVAIDRYADLADQATADENVSLAAAEAEAESVQRRQIQHALDRLAKGEYGICEACGQLIHPRRLSAIPWASLCVPCKEFEEESVEEEASPRGLMAA